jgi:ribonuclease D
LAREAGRIGVDTEFMGEGRYRPLMCLVQVAVPDGAAQRIELVDPLDDDLEPGPLADVLGDPAIEVVMHSGRQDVALLRRTWDTEVRNLFDTQVAAGFAGLGAQTGYESLLGSVLGVRLRKSASYTRWDARPLTPEQAEYARQDVEHLLALAEALQERLARSGRLEWAREECRPLETASDERVEDELFERLPRIGSLDPRARAVARELVAWRERTAAARDRTAPSVLSDVALVEVARRQPSRPAQLRELRGINEGALRRSADDILAAVRVGREREPIPRTGERRAPPDPALAPLIALAEALVRARAIEAGIAYELLASRAELQEVVGTARAGDDEPDARVLTGWRRELVGAELLDLLRGGLTLAVSPSGRLTATREGPPAEPS